VRPFDLAELDDERGSEWELAVVSEGEAHPVLKDEVHLALPGVSDFNLDEHRVSKRPRLGGFGFRNPWKIRARNRTARSQPRWCFSRLRSVCTAYSFFAQPVRFEVVRFGASPSPEGEYQWAPEI
jgi:hypothetical protein